MSLNDPDLSLRKTVADVVSLHDMSQGHVELGPIL
jgi:hypothetical protein